MSKPEIDPADDPAIESHTRAFLKAVNSRTGKMLEQLSPEEVRAAFARGQAAAEVDVSGVDVLEKIITPDGMRIRLYIISPSGQTGVLPAFLFFHGGGWMAGDFATHERLLRDLVLYSGAAAVFVDYSRTPDAGYPVPVQEAYAAIKWVAEHGVEIEVDGKRLAIAGNSVGGNIAAATVLMAKDKKGPEIRLQVLLCPVTDADFETESYNRYATSHYLTKNMMKWFWSFYVPDPMQRKERYASPLQASLSQLEGLPPALVLVAGNDVLRDEGEAYARKMDAAGVAVTLVRMPGMIHDFGLINALAGVAAVQSALRHAGNELKKALE